MNQCIEKSIELAGPKFADGIPELGIASLDPVQLGTVVVDNPSLKLTFTDTVVTGLRNFKVNSYKSVYRFCNLISSVRYLNNLPCSFRI